MSVEVLVFSASGVLVRAVILAGDKAFLRISAGYWVMATGTTSFQAELNCLFTATI